MASRSPIDFNAVPTSGNGGWPPTAPPPEIDRARQQVAFLLIDLNRYVQTNARGSPQIANVVPVLRQAIEAFRGGAYVQAFQLCAASVQLLRRFPAKPTSSSMYSPRTEGIA
jgi:hypothetical protein